MKCSREHRYGPARYLFLLPWPNLSCPQPSTTTDNHHQCVLPYAGPYACPADGVYSNNSNSNSKQQQCLYNLVDLSLTASSYVGLSSSPKLLSPPPPRRPPART